MGAVLQVIAAEEPSKLPFYAAGALLAGWAVVIGAFGLRRAKFPSSPGGARMVMAVSGLLMVAVMGTAIATASRPNKKGEGEHVGTSGQTDGQAGPQGQAGGTSAGSSGGGHEPPATGGPLALAADPTGRLAYDRKSLTARPGAVEVRFTNRSQVPHDVTIGQGARRIAGTSQITGSTATLKTRLRPGRYVFYCSVDGHRAGGMQGTLTVG